MKVAASRLVVVGAALAVTGASGFSDRTYAAAQCGVEEASKTALQRRLAVIDAAKINPSEFFNGANSCIDMNLLKSFDLSSLIPDLAGFLSGGVQNMAQQAINTAKQKVCSVLNEQINGVIGKINDTTSGFSGMSGQLSGVLGSSFNISKPSTSGYGSYDLKEMGSSFDFNGLNSAISGLSSSVGSTVSSTSSSAISTLSASPLKQKASPESEPPPASSPRGVNWLAD